jgi:F-type H+-transporting ATPase subunit epsilon
MATFHFDLVSPEKLAFSGEVDQVDVPGVEGDFGVLAGHAPIVAAIRPGILTITTGGSHQKIIVLGGLAEMSDKGLTVLADVATSLEELDRAKFADTIAGMEAISPRRKAPNSTTRSSGSITSRASRTSSIRPHCIKRIVALDCFGLIE